MYKHDRHCQRAAIALLVGAMFVAGMVNCPVAVGDPSVDQTTFIRRLYIDFVGRPPSHPEMRSLRTALAMAESNAQKREVIRKVLFEDLMVSPHFEDRLKDYFNGLFGMDIRHGRLLPLCSDGNPPPCLTDDEALDFRDEIAMTTAKVISGSGLSFPDIRHVITSSKTSITPRMAKLLLREPVLRERIGLGNVKQPDLSSIASLPDLASWHWIDRDPEKDGLPTGSAGHLEHHAGLLTSPGFLLRSTMHISRANYFYSWFLCREADQTEAFASMEVKLAERKPCSGCHAILEPLGSFWVHWRAGIDPTDTEAAWVLDGIDRRSPTGELLSDSGRIPIDDEDSIHSRTADGTFRGKSGRGVRALGLIGAQDGDFSRCMSRHAWQFVFGRPLKQEESGWARMLGDRLADQYRWDLREVMVDIVLSPGYAGGIDQ